MNFSQKIFTIVVLCSYTTIIHSQDLSESLFDAAAQRQKEHPFSYLSPGSLFDDAMKHQQKYPFSSRPTGSLFGTAAQHPSDGNPQPYSRLDRKLLPCACQSYLHPNMCPLCNFPCCAHAKRPSGTSDLSPTATLVLVAIGLAIPVTIVTYIKACEWWENRKARQSKKV
jgi:hypothetical protein